MNPILPIITGLIVAGNLLHAQEAKLVDEPFLENIRSEAVRNHPAARSASIRGDAAARDIRGIRLWDDPSVGFTLMAAEKMMRRNEGDIRLGFEQPIPKPGLYSANISKAEAIERAQWENSRMSALEVGAAAAKDAIELALVDESISLQISQIGWLEAMAENAREMSLNPDASSIDALRLESELAREKQILKAARRTRDGISQSLNLRLGRTLESSWPELKLTLNPTPSPVASSEIARIPRSNPRVRSMMEMTDAAKADVRIAEAEKTPQFAVGVETGIYSGGDVRSVGVGLKMSLPFFNRSSYEARIESSQLREKAAVGDVEATRLEVAADVISAVTEAANAAAQARAYSGEIYERARSATRSIEAAWISSKSPLTDLLDSNRILFSIRLEQRRFVAMQLAALEQLNLLVPRR